MYMSHTDAVYSVSSRDESDRSRGDGDGLRALSTIRFDGTRVMSGDEGGDNEKGLAS